jgi:hypothetical protein
MAIISQYQLIGDPLVVGRAPRTRPIRKRTVVCRVLHLGAGRQSSVLAEMVVMGELPRMDMVIFCDTGDEPSWVHEQVAYLDTRLAAVDVPLLVVRRSPQGLVYDTQHNTFGQRFATMPLFIRDPDTGKVSRLKRQCTSEYKITPADDTVLAWLLERGYAQILTDRIGRRRRVVRSDVLTEHYYGISFEEFYRAGKRGPAWQQAIYPLIDLRMTALACVEWLQVRGLRVPKKSACRVCPYHDDPYWLDLQTSAPDEFEHTCRFDDWLRTPAAQRGILRGLRGDVYLHSSCVPLRSIDFAAEIERKRGEPLPMFDLCGDHCMT